MEFISDARTKCAGIWLSRSDKPGRRLLMQGNLSTIGQSLSQTTDLLQTGRNLIKDPHSTGKATNTEWPERMDILYFVETTTNQRLLQQHMID